MEGGGFLEKLRSWGDKVENSSQRGCFIMALVDQDGLWLNSVVPKLWGAPPQGAQKNIPGGVEGPGPAPTRDKEGSTTQPYSAPALLRPHSQAPAPGLQPPATASSLAATPLPAGGPHKHFIIGKEGRGMVRGKV